MHQNDESVTRDWSAGLATHVSSAKSTDEMTQLIMKGQEHHQHNVDQLQTIISNADKGLCFGGDDGNDPIKVEAGTQLHRGVIIGVQLALNMLGEFPLSLVEREEDEDDEDWGDE